MNALDSDARRLVHLPALLISWLVVATGALVVWYGARQLERRAVDGELILTRAETNRGLAIQREVLDRDDVFLLYGSSEIVRPSLFRAMEFFRASPTGFRVVGVGDRGTPLAVTAYNLAALGESLRGRKVALSVSHNFFHADRNPDRELQTYRGTFSVLHASQIAFGGSPSASMRRRVAERLLRQPETLEREPLIRAALEWQADESRVVAPLAVAALTPLGRAQLAVLSFQDHLRLARSLRRAASPLPGGTSEAPIDWRTLSDSAERLYRPLASNNPFGMIHHWWSNFEHVLLPLRGTRTDSAWIRSVSHAPAWHDLALLLDIVTSAGGEPLLLSMPYKGAFRDFEGTTPAARRVYYDSLRAHAARAGVVSRDFAEFENDRWFMRDQSAHPSPKGWVHYDQAMDEFFRPAER